MIEWVFEPEMEFWGSIGFRPKQLPGQKFVVTFPEWFTADREGWGAACSGWDTTANSATGTWSEGDYSAALRLEYEEEETKVLLRWNLGFKNSSDKQLTDLAAFNCFSLNGAPLFKDIEMERTWVVNKGGDRALVKTIAKTQGEGRRTMQFYPTVGESDLKNVGLIAEWRATSTERLSGDRMGVVSVDGRWLAETVVDGPVAYFFNNWESDHGCIHAAPLFGDVAPGHAATAKGTILFTSLK